jgi:murein L,D-transpeptidase YafK
MWSLAALFLAFGLLWTPRGFARTVEGRLREFGPSVSKRLMPYFLGAGVAYPPRKLTFVGLKEEKILEVYAAGSNGRMRLVRSYPILAASGGPGPKLRQGDGQVPEGFYRIDAFNPDSLFHVSMRVSYPNADDKARALNDGRKDLGGDIFIHGGAASIGCLAVGDQAAEDLFVMAALANLKNVKVILSPVDFRKREPMGETTPAMKELYSRIRKELAAISSSHS